jgi:N-acetylglucosaminyl-diphospho-decaprenol L-rhamnosyltransferase
MSSNRVKISFSIVSHGQGRLIVNLLSDLARLNLESYEIIVTLNIDEDENFLDNFYRLPIKIIRNKKIKGFGENHNSAFKISSGELFAVVNPDIRLTEFNYKEIYDFIIDGEFIGACGPRVISSAGEIQDSVRIFPTIMLLTKRVFRSFLGLKNNSDYQIFDAPVKVDWVAGMFVFFKRDAFFSVGGFDERYFMYYEDADICRRMKKNGWSAYLYPEFSVIHDAQRTSWKKFKYFRWHLRSIIRILLK